MTKVPPQYIGAIKHAMGAQHLNEDDMRAVWETWSMPGITITEAARIVSNDILIRERMRHAAHQTGV
jgi:hypothetical protein